MCRRCRASSELSLGVGEVLWSDTFDTFLVKPGTNSSSAQGSPLAFCRQLLASAVHFAAAGFS